MQRIRESGGAIQLWDKGGIFGLKPFEQQFTHFSANSKIESIWSVLKSQISKISSIMVK